MNQQERQHFTELLETFVRICNKYNQVSGKPLDYGSGDLLYPSEIHMLNYLSKQQEQNISEIGRHFAISRSGASQTIMKLEKKGFCKKIKRENKRNIYIELTQKGNRALGQFQEYRNSIFDDLLEAFSHADERHIEILEDSFSRLEDHMDRMIREF